LMLVVWYVVIVVEVLVLVGSWRLSCWKYLRLYGVAVSGKNE